MELRKGYSKTQERAYHLRRRFCDYEARQQVSNRWTIRCWGHIK